MFIKFVERFLHRPINLTAYFLIIQGSNYFLIFYFEKYGNNSEKVYSKLKVRL